MQRSTRAMSDSVEFRHLEYLLAIYEGKNFTKAAERVYRSQPAISQQVRALEEDEGFPIFVRGGRNGVSPTPPGELILNWARKVLTERREVFAMARAIYNKQVPPLSSGSLPSSTLFSCRPFAPPMKNSFPPVRSSYPAETHRTRCNDSATADWIAPSSPCPLIEICGPSYR